MSILFKGGGHIDSYVKGNFTRAPRIVGLYLINIQTYTQPTFIPFSLERTVFRGPNDAGKSVISKALQLFGGVFDKEDYAILVNYDHDEGYEYLYLDNRTILVAHITVRTEFRGTENEKRVGAATFYLYNWQMSAVLKQWNTYDMDIAEYLGWVTIQEDNFCVNFMDGKRNILINTNPVFNTRLTESVCRNYDIERRIEHIEGAFKQVSHTKTQVQQEMDKLQDKLSFYALPVKSLTENRDALNNLLFNINISCYVEDAVYDLLRLGWLSRLRTEYLSMMAIIDMHIFVQSLLSVNRKEQEHLMLKELLAKTHGLTILAELEEVIERQKLQATLSLGRTRYSVIMAETSALLSIQDSIDVHLQHAVVQAEADKHSARLRTAETLDDQYQKCVIGMGILRDASSFIVGVQTSSLLADARRRACREVANYLIKECTLVSIERSAVLLLSCQSTVVIAVITVVMQLFEVYGLAESRKAVQAQKDAIPVCPYCSQIILQDRESSGHSCDA